MQLKKIKVFNETGRKIKFTKINFLLANIFRLSHVKLTAVYFKIFWIAIPMKVCKFFLAIWTKIIPNV